MVEVEIDADTGEEIIYFIRRGKPYLYLRSATTKRFIKKLETVEKRHYMVVDYDEKHAKKKNPIYIDAGAYTQIKPEFFPKRHEVDEKLEDAITNKISTMFGYSVANRLLENAGYEIGTEPHYKSEYNEKKATILIVWKHKKRAEGKTKEEEVTLWQQH